jgi:hypothetical protein
MILGAAGYTTLSNIGSLNDLNAKVANLLSELSVEESALVETTTPEGVLVTVTAGAETDIPTPTPPKFIEVIFPKSGQALVLSSDPNCEQSSEPVCEHAKVVIRLKAHGTNFNNVVVNLTLLREIKDNVKLPIQPGLTNEPYSPDDMVKDEEKNIILEFKKNSLPSSGSYEGRLIILATDAYPTSHDVTVDIVRPNFEFQHRISQDPSATIEFRGIRRFISTLWFLPDEISWEPYTFRFWNKDPRQVVIPYVFSSELSNPNTGHTGYLRTTFLAEMPLEGDEARNEPTTATSSSNPETVSSAETEIPDNAPLSNSGTAEGNPYIIRIEPELISLPGTYEGLINIVSEDGGTLQNLKVKAHIRDSLWWPFIVICLGVLGARHLIHWGMKSTGESIPFQRLRIKLAERHLRRLPACEGSSPNPICDRLREKLALAEHALEINDVSSANIYIRNVEDSIDKFRASEITFNEKKHAIDAIADKYKEIDDQKVKDELKVARDWLRIAQSYLNVGLFEEMTNPLAQIPIAIKIAEKRLKIERGKCRISEKPRIVYKRLPESNNNDFHWDPFPTFFTDDEIKFKVEDALSPNKMYFWRIKWVRNLRPDEYVGEPSNTQKKYLQCPIIPNHRDNFPRQYRVEAIDKKNDPPITLDFMMEHRYQIEFGHPLAYEDEKISFELNPHYNNAVDWQIIPNNKKVTVKNNKYQLKQGEYRVAAVINNAKKCIAARDLIVYEEPFKKARRRYKLMALWVSPIAWSIAAGIAGLVYINAKLHTFGSPLDYILALGWGLGVGATVSPKKNLGDAITKALGIKQEPAQSIASAPAKQTQQPAENLPTKIMVPDMKNRTLKDVQTLYEGIFQFKQETEGAEETWVIEKHEPEYKEEVEPNTTITLTLKPPSD